MDETERRRLVAIPLALAVVAALAWAGSQGGARVGGVPVFALCAAFAVGVQWIAFAPAYLARTERYYDLTGSLTYLATTGLALWLSGPAGDRSVLLGALVAIWAARLGSFLFKRIVEDGSDGRFDEIKASFIRFLAAWTIQGVWICFTAGAALAAMTTTGAEELDAFAWVGLVVWLFGFGVEVVADRQKRAFRAQSENEGDFISTGLWAWSRHPNYFGEIVLWIGVAIAAFPALSGWQLATLVSPVFVTLLLTRASGIPLLEKRADERWGGQADYEAYKAATPVLVPRPPR